jgi:2,3-dihydroxybenzoate-AMP ligase
MTAAPGTSPPSIALPGPGAGPDLVPWPEPVAQEYRARGYWRGVGIGHALEQAAEAHPDKVAIADPQTRLTFSDLISAARRRAAGLTQLGLRPGDVVVPQLPNTVEFALTMAALWLGGFVPVAALPAHRHREIAEFLGQTGAAAHIVPAADARHDYPTMAANLPGGHLRICLGDRPQAGLIPMVEIDAPPRRTDPVDPAGIGVLQLSTGSTGVPKLIPRTHDDYLYTARACWDATELTQDDIYVAALPAAHNFALISPGVLGSLVAGTTVVFSPTPSPVDCFAAVKRYGATWTSLIPPVALAWLMAAEIGGVEALATLRVMQIGGATCPPALAARIEPELGCRLQQMFGMAEGMIACTRPGDPPDVIVHTQGQPVSPGDELRIVDRDGQPAPAEGELLARGPYTIRGYYRSAAVNREAFTPDGFYRTGDLVRRTPDGGIRVTGRVKDQINRGGEKVGPDEVEDCLLRHAGVHDAVVLGVPDPYLGERVCAVVIPRPDCLPPPTARDLRQHVRSAGLADFKVPDRIEFVQAYPAVGVGKTSRRDLRALLAAILTRGAS